MKTDININNYDDLMSFVKRKDVSAMDAINVFEKAFNSVDIMCITFVDAVTKESNLDKETVIQKISEFVDEIKKGKDCKMSAIIFN